MKILLNYSYTNVCVCEPKFKFQCLKKCVLNQRQKNDKGQFKVTVILFL